MTRYIFTVAPFDSTTIAVEAADYDDAYTIATDWCQRKGDETNIYWKILDSYAAGPGDDADHEASDLVDVPPWVDRQPI